MGFSSVCRWFQAPASQTKEAVKSAVKAGFRLIDCANDYDNEHVIGEALEELFAEGVVKRLIFNCRSLNWIISDKIGHLHYFKEYTKTSG